MQRCVKNRWNLQQEKNSGNIQTRERVKPGYQHVDKASNTTATKEHVQHYVMITVS